MNVRSRMARVGRGGMSLIVAGAVAVVVVGVVLGVRAADAGPGADDKVDMTAVLNQNRPDELIRKVEVSVFNRGPLPVRVESLQLVAPPFKVLPAVPVDGPVEPGNLQVDLPITYGPVTCPQGIKTIARQAYAVADVRSADGKLHHIRFEFASPSPLLSRLVRTDCGIDLLGKTAEIKFGDVWTPAKVSAGAAISGTVDVIRKSGDAPVTVVDMAGNTTYDLSLNAPRHPLAVLSGAARKATVPVTIGMQDCASHRLIESKKGFIYPVWVTVGDSPTLFLTISPDDSMRSKLLGVLAQVCNTRG